MLGLLLIGNPVFANENEQKALKNVAMGVLANMDIAIDNVVVLDVKPLEENNTILQIAYKNLLTDHINMVYAISEKSVIANGLLITEGKINQDFMKQIERVTPIDKEVLDLLVSSSIKITDKMADTKENLYIVLSPNSAEFDFLFRSNHYLEILEKYNLNLVLVNNSDETLYKNAEFVMENLSIKNIKDILDNQNKNYKIDDAKIDYFKNVKKILENTKNLNKNEINGDIPIYFINDKRINPNKLINNLNTTQNQEAKK